MVSVVRRVPTGSIHLTFDDGPVRGATERVLDVLAECGARATFFVVVERARRERTLLDRIRQGGHAVGNHSWDHRYGAFFGSERKLREWVYRAHEELSGWWGAPPVGFRSPAGVRTPPLHRVLRELDIPLVHWNLRFFDTVFPFGAGRAKRAARSVTPGSIILLHDVRLDRDGERFADALRTFLAGVAARSLPADSLRTEDVRAALTGNARPDTVRA